MEPARREELLERVAKSGGRGSRRVVEEDRSSERSAESHWLEVIPEVVVCWGCMYLM